MLTLFQIFLIAIAVEIIDRIVIKVFRWVILVAIITSCFIYGWDTALLLASTIWVLRLIILPLSLVLIGSVFKRKNVTDLMN